MTQPALSLDQVYKTATQWRDNATANVNPRRNPYPADLYKTNAPPVVVVQSPTNIVVYAHLDISGTGATTANRQAVVDGIRDRWAGTYDNKTVSVRTIDVSTNKSIVPSNQPSIGVNIIDGYGTSTGWAGGPMTLYTGWTDKAGVNHSYTSRQFQQMAAHEFGHSGFNLKDTYTDGHPNPDTGLATTNSQIVSIMRDPFTTRAQQVDYDMIFQNRSWESSSYIHYSSRPDIMDAHFGAGNW